MPVAEDQTSCRADFCKAGTEASPSGAFFNVVFGKDSLALVNVVQRSLVRKLEDATVVTNPADISLAPVGYWQMDTDDYASGPNTTLDSSGNGLDLDIGTAASLVDANYGKGYNMPGGAGTLDSTLRRTVHDAALTITGDVTVLGYIKLDTMPGGTNYRIASFSATSGTSANNRLYEMSIDSSGHLVAAHQFGTASNAVVTDPAAAAAGVGVWAAVGIVRDTAAKTYRFFRNDSLSSTFAYGTNPDGGGSSKFYIGGNENDLQNFDGVVDNFAVFNYALTEAQIRHFLSHPYLASRLKYAVAENARLRRLTVRSTNAYALTDADVRHLIRVTSSAYSLTPSHARNFVSKLLNSWSMSDALLRHFVQMLSNQYVVSENTSQRRSVSYLTDPFALASTAQRNLVTRMSNAFSLTDADVRRFVRILLNSYSIAENAPQRNLGQRQTDQYALVATSLRRLVHWLNNQFAVGENANLRRLLHRQTDSYLLTDADLRRLVRILSNFYSLQDSVARNVIQTKSNLYAVAENPHTRAMTTRETAQFELEDDLLRRLVRLSTALYVLTPNVPIAIVTKVDAVRAKRAFSNLEWYFNMWGPKVFGPDIIDAMDSIQVESRTAPP